MKVQKITLEQMLAARERRAEIQNRMLGREDGTCLVCLTLNIAGDIKRTPMTGMLFQRGIEEFDSLGFDVIDSRLISEPTGDEAFWLLRENARQVKQQLEAVEESFPAARLFDFDVLVRDTAAYEEVPLCIRKLSRKAGRKCLICGRPAADCSRSRRHGLDAVRTQTGRLLTEFCAETLARYACDALLDELYTTPKPGLVDLANCGAHTDMDVPLFEKSAESLKPYFHDAVVMGMGGCSMEDLRKRGLKAEEEMFRATGGVNTHKGMIYSMGLLLAGMGRCLIEGGSCTSRAADLAREDAEIRLKETLAAPVTNGGAVYRTYGARGATGEAAAGFPDALYCMERLIFYRDSGCDEPAALALCDSMASLEDTNLLHRGGREGLDHVMHASACISGMPAEKRVEALNALDRDLISRRLSPGGSADILALAFLLDRWHVLSADIFIDGREDR